MYSFRKPFSAGYYEGLEWFGIEYKILLVISQVVGYMLSKFIGIKIISELNHATRAQAVLGLIGFGWISLLLFAVVPKPLHIFAIFLNGLPLGMIWGIVFSYLEGRKFTEMLGAGMAASFIVASGAVKSIGRTLIDQYHVPEFWMPFATGALFVIPLLLAVWALEQIPEPNHEDETLRTKRIPMDGKMRIAFFRRFALGIIGLVFIYLLLTAYRDFRDNFAVELWLALGFGEAPEILTLSEIPIALGVLIIVGLMVYIKDNKKAFWLNHNIILGGALLVGLSTFAFQLHWIGPVVWMISIGFGMYLSYITYHTMLFERWIALFRIKSNIGFLMYISDSFGYLGSVTALLFKHFFAKEMSWLNFFIHCSYGMAVLGVLITVFVKIYFKRKVAEMERTRSLL